jgi:ligand-binding SRPBCC domain-containing protein
MLPRPLDEAFKFFADPRCVEVLTPSSMRFRLVGERPDSIQQGTVLNYRFYLFRIPLWWQTRIESVDPPNSFVDVQQKGPFSHWRHTQTFVSSGSKSTEILDRFEFGLRFGSFGEFVYRTVMKTKIRQIIDYRANKLDLMMHANPLRPAKVKSKSETPRQRQS